VEPENKMFKIIFNEQHYGVRMAEKTGEKSFDPISVLALQCSVYLFVLLAFITIFKSFPSIVAYRIYISPIFGWLAAFGIGYPLKLEPKKNLIYSISIAIIISVITIALSVAGISI
jgi:hypothetical protein